MIDTADLEQLNEDELLDRITQNHQEINKKLDALLEKFKETEAILDCPTTAADYQ